MHGVSIQIQIKQTSLHSQLKLKLFCSPVDLKITIISSYTVDKHVRWFIAVNINKENQMRKWIQEHTEEHCFCSSMVTLPLRFLLYILVTVAAAK